MIFESHFARCLRWLESARSWRRSMDKLVTFSARYRKESSFLESDSWRIVCFMHEFWFRFDIVAVLLFLLLQVRKSEIYY